MKRFTQETELEICAEYLEGISSPKLASCYLTSAATICNVLERHNIPRVYTAWPKGVPNLKSRRFPVEVEREICARYVNSQKVVELASAYKTCAGTIYGILKRYDIPRKRSYRYILLQPEFFQSIRTEQQAYWLGFIAADGHINQAQNKLRLNLHLRDIDHLKRFKRDIGSSHPLYKYSYATQICVLNIYHAGLVQDLLQFPGFESRRKSAALRWPPMLPIELTNHYLRGVIDGDGGFYVYKRKNRPSLNYYFSLTSNSKLFLSEIQDRLVTACAVNRNKIKSGRDDTSTLAYGGRQQVKRILSFIYQDATLWLPRKLDRVRPYFQRVLSEANLVKRTQAVL